MERLTRKQISEWFSEWFDYFKGLDKGKKVKYFLSLLLIIAGATYYYLNINIDSTNIQNNNGSNLITIQNSSFTNSPIIQGGSNNSVLYITNPTTNTETESVGPNPFFHTQVFNLYSDLKADRYFVKVVLPDRQIAFLDEFLHNTRYNIAQCNNENTDCYIYSKFRVIARFQSLRNI